MKFSQLALSYGFAGLLMLERVQTHATPVRAQLLSAVQHRPLFVRPSTLNEYAEGDHHGRRGVCRLRQCR